MYIYIYILHCMYYMLYIIHDIPMKISVLNTNLNELLASDSSLVQSGGACLRQALFLISHSSLSAYLSRSTLVI